jgi:hypothetical protein
MCIAQVHLHSLYRASRKIGRNATAANSMVRANQTCHNLPSYPNSAMQEFVIYLPTTMNDGTPVDSGEIARIKDTLVKAFGGYTHLSHRSEGAWRMGGVTFHDEVTIIRVLDDGSAHFDMQAFKKSIEAALKQEAILIVAHDVKAV